MGWNNFPENWETDGKPQIEILDVDKIPKELKIGNKYHCSWASSKGMVWILSKVIRDKIILKTPRTGKTILTEAKSLRLINKDAKQNAIARINKK